MLRQDYDKTIGNYSPEGRIYQYRYATRNLQNTPGLISFRFPNNLNIIVRAYNSRENSLSDIQQGYLELRRGIRMFCLGIPLDVTLFMNSFQSEFISESQLFSNSGTPLRSFNNPLAVSLARTTANLMRVCSIGGLILISGEDRSDILRFNLQGALVLATDIELIGLFPENVIDQTNIWTQQGIENIHSQTVLDFFEDLNSQTSAGNFYYVCHSFREPSWDHEINQSQDENEVVVYR